MIYIPCREKIILALENQLSMFWNGLFDKNIIEKVVEIAFDRIETNLDASNIDRFRDDDREYVFSIYNTTQWSIFLYYLSNSLAERGYICEADVVYYLNKVMHSVDWYHQIQLPEHFMVEHPVGSVLGRAQYGDYLMVYQGVTVGGNRKNTLIEYPKLGSNVLLYSNSSIIGNSVIGNNVIVSSGCCILNEIIPDNCIVFGKSPNLEIKHEDIDDIKKRTSHIWKCIN